MLLDAVLDYLPSPLDVPPVKGTTLDGEEVTREASDSAPMASLAFKIMADPFVGKLAFFRVYSGIMNQGTYVLNSTKGKKERVGRILQMHANHRKEIDCAYSGDIAAELHHRRYPLRCRSSDHPRKNGIPGSGHFRCC